MRLRPVGAPSEAPVPEPVAEAVPAAGLAPGVRDQLRALAAAASGGQLAPVAKLMEAITPEAIGAERWRALDDAAQAYDFQLLEERVAALIASLDAANAPG